MNRHEYSDGSSLVVLFLQQISSNDYEHLNDLSRIKYLVIDEADRMIQLGSFPQLSSILDAVQRANPMVDDDDDEEDLVNDTGIESSMGRMLGLPGIPGESRVTMLSDDILRRVAAQRGEAVPEPMELPEERMSDNDEVDESADAMDSSDEELALPSLPPVHRQTFVFSATLTLPSTSTAKPAKQRRHDFTVGGAIAEILDKAHAKGRTKVVDLSTNTKGNELIEPSNKTSKPAKMAKTAAGVHKFQLPPGLELHQIKCTQKHKDSYLYAYLMTTAEGNSGPCLVFCNSIACVRRVGKTLEALGLDVRILHAQMQQVRRYNSNIRSYYWQ